LFIIPETLLILKQGVEIERGNSVKGEKDRLDIVSLLFFGEINFKKYKSILRNHKLEDYINKLISLVSGFQDYHSFSLNPREFKLKKRKILNELRKL